MVERGPAHQLTPTRQLVQAAYLEKYYMFLRCRMIYYVVSFSLRSIFAPRDHSGNNYPGRVHILVPTVPVRRSGIYPVPYLLKYWKLLNCYVFLNFLFTPGNFFPFLRNDYLSPVLSPPPALTPPSKTHLNRKWLGENGIA